MTVVTQPDIQLESPAATPYFEPLLTADEAAAHLRIHPKTLQKLAREGRVPCIRMGKYWRFRLSVLDLWLEQQQNQFSQPFRVKCSGDQS